MNDYELLYIISPRVPADEVANAIERVSGLVLTAGGEVTSVDNWGRRRLAYPIRQYFEGTYVLCTLQLPAAGAAVLEASLVISEEIIRHLLLSGIVPRTSGGRMRDERDRNAEPSLGLASEMSESAVDMIDVEPGDAESESPEEVAAPAAAE